MKINMVLHHFEPGKIALIVCTHSNDVFGIGSARWPDGPPQSGVAQGFDLVPVSAVGEAVGGVSEAVGDEKIGGNGVERTFNKDMTKDELTFLDTQTNRQA